MDPIFQEAYENGYQRAARTLPAAISTTATTLGSSPAATSVVKKWSEYTVEEYTPWFMVKVMAYGAFIFFVRLPAMFVWSYISIPINFTFHMVSLLWSGLTTHLLNYLLSPITTIPTIVFTFIYNCVSALWTPSTFIPRTPMTSNMNATETANYFENLSQEEWTTWWMLKCTTILAYYFVKAIPGFIVKTVSSMLHACFVVPYNELTAPGPSVIETLWELGFAIKELIRFEWYLYKRYLLKPTLRTIEPPLKFLLWPVYLVWKVIEFYLWILWQILNTLIFRPAISLSSTILEPLWSIIANVLFFILSPLFFLWSLFLDYIWPWVKWPTIMFFTVSAIYLSIEFYKDLARQRKRREADAEFEFWEHDDQFEDYDDYWKRKEYRDQAWNRRIDRFLNTRIMRMIVPFVAPIVQIWITIRDFWLYQNDFWDAIDQLRWGNYRNFFFRRTVLYCVLIFGIWWTSYFHYEEVTNSVSDWYAVETWTPTWTNDIRPTTVEVTPTTGYYHDPWAEVPLDPVDGSEAVPLYDWNPAPWRETTTEKIISSATETSTQPSAGVVTEVLMIDESAVETLTSEQPTVSEIPVSETVFVTLTETERIFRTETLSAATVTVTGACAKAETYTHTQPHTITESHNHTTTHTHTHTEIHSLLGMGERSSAQAGPDGYFDLPNGTTDERQSVGEDEVWCSVCQQYHCCELPY